MTRRSRLFRHSWFRRHPVWKPETSQAYPQQSVSAVSDHYSGCGLQRFWECLLLSWRELWLRSTSAVPMTAAATAVRPTIYDQATGKHWLGILFAVFMILTYMVGFNLVASFNIADAFRVIPAYSQNENLAKWIIGGVLAVLFFVCISERWKTDRRDHGKDRSVHGILLHCGCRVRDRDPYHTSQECS